MHFRSEPGALAEGQDAQCARTRSGVLPSTRSIDTPYARDLKAFATREPNAGTTA